MTVNSPSAPATTPALQSKPERPRLKWTLIAFLWMASFCSSIYLSWIPGPAERRLVGYWKATFHAGGLIGDVQILMELRKNRYITTWLWNHEDSRWEPSGDRGRWAFDGNEFEVRVAAEGDRRLEDVMETIFAGRQHVRLLVADADVDRLVLRVSDSDETYEWRRVPEPSLPELRR